MWLLDPTRHVDVARDARKTLVAQQADIFHLPHAGPVTIHKAAKRKTPQPTFQ